MKYSRRGKRTFPVEVRNVTARGFTLTLGDRDLAVAFKDVPWFRAFTVAELAEVVRPSIDHLRWPRFDIDLEVESLEHPDRYPLVERRLRGSPAQVAERLRSQASETAPSARVRRRRVKVREA